MINTDLQPDTLRYKPNAMKIAIVGGGITGLSTAWYLERQAETKGLDLEYILLEQSDRWGGKILTERVGDFVIEGGPDSFLAQKPWAMELAVELGLEDRLLGTNDHARKVYVLNQGRPTPLPDGVMMIVPTKIMPFALSPLISPLGKLRMGMDLFIPAKRDAQDETLADFVSRRLGGEALDKIAEPLMTGIYNAEADRQSILATFPRFRDIESKHGSLIRGMLASRRNRARSTPPKPGNRPTTMFITMKGGAQELVNGVASRLRGDLRLNAGIRTMTRANNGAYTLTMNDGSIISADAVILATPAYVAADLVRNLAPVSADELDRIRYVSTGTVSLGYRRDEFEHPLNGFGIVIPISERRPINAITWTSTKFDHRAPQDHVLVRVFFGGSRSPATMDLDDDTLMSVVRSELQSTMGVEAEPVMHRIHRWQRSNPQYDVGHLDRVSQIEAALPPNLYVVGGAYRGIGVPDCVHQGQIAAEKTVNALAEMVRQ